MTLEEIINNIDYTFLFNKKDIELGEFSKDTRTIAENDVYVAIKGENFDGHDFIMEAIKKKASLIISEKELSEEIISKNVPILIVDNTIKTLQDIALYKRNKYDIPVIAITGSVGKTSTKDMVASIVSEEYKTLYTSGNYNNHIGLPLTILKLKDHEALVVEMGMNHPHEIEVLSNIAKPTVAVITNIGTAHIGILKSRENILKAKLEILSGLNGPLIINNDNDLLHEWNSKNKTIDVITYGINNKSDIMPSKIDKEEDYTNFNYKDQTFLVPVGGEHFLYNALCALAVGEVLNISLDKIKNGLENFKLSSNRMEILKGSYTIIDDTYNANYDSMVAALKYLDTLKGRKIAVLGDMLELGKYSKTIHKNISKEINMLKLDVLITVGKESSIINKYVKIPNYHFQTNEEASEFINTIKHKNDCILLKASNGMHFKEILEKIK